MQQDKKFIWSAVQIYDIRFHVMCTHHSCSLTTMDQALMATILNVTMVKTSAHKCFRCGGFDHLVDRCPFPQTASLEMVKIMRKGVQARQTAKSGSSKATSPHDQISGSTMGERAVITSNWTDAHSPIANEHMSVATVSRSTLLPDVVLVAQSPLHLNSFCKYLANHANQAWCTKLLQGIEYGLDIDFEGERTSMISDNWKSALDHPGVITEYLTNEIAAGCKAGPFTQPPFSDFYGSLMGIVTKKHSFPVKYRITHNLSWPPQDSFNDHINLDAFWCFYGSFDDAVALILKHGVGTLSAKLDLANAFKHTLIRSQDWPLLGSSLDLQHPDSSMFHLYYIDLFLTFGLHSSPALFNEYADTLQYAMETNNAQDLLHYLDDYFTVGLPHSPVCTSNIATMIAIYEELGFTVNSEKVTKPATTTNFLRVAINSVAIEARINPACLSKTISLLKDIVGHWSATKCSILSLVGKLYFVCHVCRPSRPFLHCMIETSMKARHLHHRIKLNQEFHRDID